MSSEGSEKHLLVTQVSVGGFSNHVSAKTLVEYIEEKFGAIWRCRLKTSSTPPDSYPDFNINPADVRRKGDYEKVEPHAFLHLARPDSAKELMDAAGKSELMLEGNLLKINLGPDNPYRMNQLRRDKEPFKLSDVIVEIGSMVSQNQFYVGWRGSPKGVDFIVDPFNGTCKFLFTRDTAFSLEGTANHAIIKCNFKVEFLVRNINDTKEFKESSHLILLLQLASSPLIYYRTADDDIEVSVPFDLLDDDDPWVRTTDFTPSGSIGRCNTYRISVRPRAGPMLMKAMNYLKEQRVPIEQPAQPIRVHDEPDFGMPLSDPFFCIHHKSGLSFKILFLLNAVLHKCIINQHQLSDSFYDLLKTQPEEINLAALKHIYSCRRPLYDAYGRLVIVQEWLLNNPLLIERPREVNNIVEVRRLIITPTKAYCVPPETELSNRVLRNYRSVADRFLRVTFMDEGMETLNKNVLNFYPAPIVKDITSNSNPQKTTMFRRVRNILSKGFYLCGRNYSFLAFSPNQLRDRTAWFFAEDRNITCKGIRSWMGRFHDKNVAKCAARMGQCFSSTYATVEVPSSAVDLKHPDVKRNGHNFSDGIGMISPDLAMEVAERLKLEDDPPCAYQIRYAGCKGVIACWPPKKDGKRLFLRESMNKFDSDHSVLEICSWTKLQPGFLNRQIITLLSSLGVQDEVFWNMQDIMISKLNKMLVDTSVAFDILIASCGEQCNTAAIMLSAGFKPETEPHLRGMLSCVRAAQLQDLREKARIFVPSGRWLMGCFDELGVLEQGQCYIQVSNPSIENCFVKHGSRFSERRRRRRRNIEVVKGLVVIAKNPCLHPGDIRILEAVDVPGLDHLYDCLVFPQNGDRPHTNEASGSDLDGDLYFATWNQNLVPPSQTSWPPMDYSSPEIKTLPREVKLQDIVNFFTKSLLTESLGVICNAHVVHADLKDDGALDDDCIKLAELAALAVDFPKTGKAVTLPYKLRPKMYPDFMGKEDFQSYKSNKILGKMYRQIIDGHGIEEASSSVPSFVPANIHYDTDLEISGSSRFIEEAWEYKCSYDGQVNGLLGQYKVNKEEEIVIGHIWSMPKSSSRKQGEVKERVMQVYSGLRKEFREVFEHLDSDLGQLSDEEKNAIYEKKASAWYQVTYHPDWVKKSLEMKEPDGCGENVMLSFAWIAADYLARIKIRCGEEQEQPLDLLSQCIAIVPGQLRVFSPYSVLFLVLLLLAANLILLRIA